MHRLTKEDIQRGWYPLSCGCHGHVFSPKVARKVPLNAIEYCPIVKLGGVAKIEVLEAIEKREARGLNYKKSLDLFGIVRFIITEGASKSAESRRYMLFLFPKISLKIQSRGFCVRKDIDDGSLHRLKPLDFLLNGDKNGET